MGKLSYSMGVSLDGFIAGPDGEIDWSAPDEELHRFHNQQMREVGVHLCGRRLYETMVFWETAEEKPSIMDYELSFEQHAVVLPPGAYRPLSPADRASLAKALEAHPPLNPLWQEILKDASAKIF